MRQLVSLIMATGLGSVCCTLSLVSTSSSSGMQHMFVALRSYKSRRQPKQMMMFLAPSVARSFASPRLFVVCNWNYLVAIKYAYYIHKIKSNKLCICRCRWSPFFCCVFAALLYLYSLKYKCFRSWMQPQPECIWLQLHRIKAIAMKLCLDPWGPNGGGGSGQQRTEWARARFESLYLSRAPYDFFSIRRKQNGTRINIIVWFGCAVLYKQMSKIIHVCWLSFQFRTNTYYIYVAEIKMNKWRQFEFYVGETTGPNGRARSMFLVLCSRTQILNRYSWITCQLTNTLIK